MRLELDDGTIIEGTAEEIAKFYEIAGGCSDECSAYHVSVDGEEVRRHTRELETDNGVEVGDKIRIVDAEMSFGNYGNEDILTVSNVGKGFILAEESDVAISINEFEVIDDVGVKVGDKIRIIFVYRINEGDYEVGDVFTVTEVGRSVWNDTIVHVKEHGIVLRGEEFEVIDEEPTKFSEGGYVVMKEDGVFDDIHSGDVVVYAGLNKSSGMTKVELLDGSDYDFATEDELEKVDVNDDRMAFIRAGRRVGEYKDGDIAQYTYTNDDEIVIVKGTKHDVVSGEERVLVKTLNYGVCNESKEDLRLVCPVENRVDIHAE